MANKKAYQLDYREVTEKRRPTTRPPRAKGMDKLKGNKTEALPSDGKPRNRAQRRMLARYQKRVRNPPDTP